MVTGVSTGFVKAMEINGTGYRAAVTYLQALRDVSDMMDAAHKESMDPRQ